MRAAEDRRAHQVVEEFRAEDFVVDSPARTPDEIERSFSIDGGASSDTESKASEEMHVDAVEVVVPIDRNDDGLGISQARGRESRLLREGLIFPLNLHPVATSLPP